MNIYVGASFFKLSEFDSFERLEIRSIDNSFVVSYEETYQISCEMLENTSEKEVDEYRLFVDNSELSFTKINFANNNTNSISYNGNTYSIYLNKNHHLIITKNKFPKLSELIFCNNINKIEAIDEQVIVELQIKTSFNDEFTPYLVLKNREIKEEKNFECFASENDLYSFSFTKDEFLTLVNEFDQIKYIVSSVDFYLTVDFKDKNVQKSKARVSNKNVIDQELWFDHQQTKVLIRLYPTVLTNASLRLAYLPVESYDAYINEACSTEKNVVLVCEYPYTAQNNGEAMFKYLCDKYPNNFNTYYIITENSMDLSRLKDYMDNVVFYKTAKHVELFNACKILLHTHASNYAYPVLTYNNKLVADNIYKLFLQHGITASKENPGYTKTNNPGFTNGFVVSNYKEKEIIHTLFGYDEQEIHLFGLARFDNLFSKKNTLKHKIRKKNNILILPTYRKEYEYATEEQFCKSEYYKKLVKLINSNDLKKCVDKYDAKLTLNLHPIFFKFSHLFESKFVNVIKDQSQFIQQLIIDNDILITDYSSVGLDFAIQQKPVIYYRFDKNHKDLRNDQEYIPGPICTNLTDLVAKIDQYLKTPKLAAEYITRLDDIYLYRDNHARQRTAKHLLSILNK